MADAGAIAAGTPKVLFLGMLGRFSVPPLEILLAAGLPVCAVMLPAPGGSRRRGVRQLPPALLRLTNKGSIGQIAHDHHIPVFEASDLKHVDTLDTVRRLNPDVLAVACFDRLIPRELRALAALAVNLHPSLLPENRGPAPLFWTFRLGLTRTGVTVHVLEDAADSGAILAQAEVAVPDGIDGAELERQLAELGGHLLVEVIRSFQRGQLAPRPQDETRATAYGFPSADDWLIPEDWTPQRASNFRRGVSHMHAGGHYP